MLQVGGSEFFVSSRTLAGAELIVEFVGSGRKGFVTVVYVCRYVSSCVGHERSSHVNIGFKEISCFTLGVNPTFS